MGDRLTTIDIGRKVGAAAPLSVGDLCPHNAVSPGPRPTSIPSGWRVDPSSRLATIDMGRGLYVRMRACLRRLACVRKLGKCVATVALSLGELGPHLTQHSVGMPPY